MWFKRILTKAYWVTRSIFIRIFKGAFGYFYSEVKALAEEVTGRLETVDWTNDQKREKAFNDIKALADEKRLYYTTNWINIAIGIALMTIRKEF